MLDVFYSLMIIYIPLHLRHTIGFSWTEISIVFTIMLLPFILFQIPVGKMADSWCGEKELMTLGLFIMGVSLILMPFLHAPSVPLWAALLFLSRTGASVVEITTESYFFKHVDKRDAGLISVFRLSWPVAFIIGPAIGALTLYLFPFDALFLVMALGVLFTMHTSAMLQDTL
jgi:MFS family permease